MESYKDLIVWQRSMELVVAIYELTDKYPRNELYGLIAHTRKSAISIPSNIAEGRRRNTRKDFRHFLTHAYASGAELETQIEIAKRLNLSERASFEKVDCLLNEIMRMLNTMIIKLVD
ncbi:MAG: four helix bundle protein [Candidatus Falkowbacteria bacterium]